jgi:hypothetical protein
LIAIGKFPIKLAASDILSDAYFPAAAGFAAGIGCVIKPQP